MRIEQENTVAIQVQIRNETDNAFLVSLESGRSAHTAWVPKSQVEVEDQYKVAMFHTMHMPERLARKKWLLRE